MFRKPWLYGLVVMGLTTPLTFAFADNEDRSRTILVEGKGEASGVPDIATVVAGVVTQAASATEAIKANNDAVTRVLSVADEFGIAGKDLQTSGFTVSPRYDREKPGVIAGYNVTNRVRMVSRDLDNLGKLLDALIQSGSNRIDGVTFGIDQPDDIAAQARKNAMRDARERAMLYAAEADGRLGKVIRIQENVVAAPMPRAAVAMESARFSADSQVPIARGEQVMTARVIVEFELTD